MFWHLLSYALIRAVGWPLSLLPYPVLHRIGNFCGLVIYHCDHYRRKRALNNLSIVNSLDDHPLSPTEKERIAKAAFQNLAITCLEFFRLPKSKNHPKEIVTYENWDVVEKTFAQGRGLILFTGHLANWEAAFLGVSLRLGNGICIGKKVKNPFLWKWIVSIREINGAKVFLPREAMQKGIEAMRQGRYLGIVGDQAYPESSYSFPLFGVPAKSSPAPALMAYRTRAPIIATRVIRRDHRYFVTFSDPIWPDTERPLKEEIVRMMDILFTHLQESIRQTPGQWLWLHNCFKQVGINHLQRRFRHDFILLVLPQSPQECTALWPQLAALFRLYPKSFFTLLYPKEWSLPESHRCAETIGYTALSELFRDDWKSQLLFDFANVKGLSKHYLERGVFCALTCGHIRAMACSHGGGDRPFGQQLIFALCKPHISKDPHARRSFLSLPPSPTA